MLEPRWYLWYLGHFSKSKDLCQFGPLKWERLKFYELKLKFGKSACHLHLSWTCSLHHIKQAPKSLAPPHPPTSCKDAKAWDGVDSPAAIAVPYLVAQRRVRTRKSSSVAIEYVHVCVGGWFQIEKFSKKPKVVLNHPKFTFECSASAMGHFKSSLAGQLFHQAPKVFLRFNSRIYIIYVYVCFYCVVFELTVVTLTFYHLTWIIPHEAPHCVCTWSSRLWPWPLRHPPLLQDLWAPGQAATTWLIPRCNKLRGFP